MHGVGVFEWTDGRVYKGSFANDRKEGQGILTWGDGRIYDGQWRNGKQHGQGFFTSSDGQRQQGQWADGKVQCWFNENGERITSNSYLDEA